ncbi:metallophosphoesterase [Thalassomonas viridans]|uniref:Metallophosphoesterase n=1 Tax=Thalassomonas viridans TaxID=137584 RepID=A0AAE9Z4H5_9GAMM|nr:metallophosphoesterase [Thalassomonas viridans]WDE05874.1 metallophosphoesterase [Thalassomonas viridans]
MMASDVNLAHPYRELPLNTQGTDYFVGDIHGNYYLLLEQLKQVDFSLGDRLIAVGDLIDRGQDSALCLQLLKQPWFFSVLGNHEHMFLQSSDVHIHGMEHCSNAEAIHHWYRHYFNGGDWLEPYQADEILGFKTLIEQYCSLALSVETGWDNKRLGVTHAAAPENWQDLQQGNYLAANLKTLLWDRGQFQSDKAEHIRNIALTVHGHNGCRAAFKKGNQVYIDTQYRSGRFTIISLESLLAL